MLVVSVFAVNIMADSTSGGPSTSGSSKLSTSGGGQRYFGGKITAMVPCPDEGGQAIILTGGLSSGTYFYLPGSVRLYRNYNVTPGKWVLGKYVSGGVCTADGVPVITISKGTITFVGTS